MEQPSPNQRIRLDASPAKRLTPNLARSDSPDIAFFELIDNAVDVWRSETPAQDLNINIKFEFYKSLCSRIHVQDNGGGIPVERLEALVRPGIENPNETAIGVWGQGLKIACIVLGARAIIKTRFREGPTYQISLDDQWWNSSSWELWAEPQPPENELPPGAFEVVIEDLKQPLRREEIFGPSKGEALIDRLSRIYAPLLSVNRSPRINLQLKDTLTGDEKPVEAAIFGDPARFGELFAFPPGFPPTQHTYWLDSNRQLKVDIVVGLLSQQSRDLSGVTMYGKGRMFAQALKEGRVGFGTRGPALIPASHPTTWRLLVLMYFDGPSELIPWMSGTKDGYTDNNLYFEDIRSIISKLASPYAAFTRVAKRIDILPFSVAWNNLSSEEIEKEVMQFCRDSKMAQQILAENPHLKKDFSPPVIERINKRNDDSTMFPCLSLETSKTIARRLSKREKNKDFSPWSLKWLTIGSRPDSTPSEGNLEKYRSNEAEFAETLDLQLKKRTDVWKETRRVTIALPSAAVDLIQNTATSSMSDWSRDAVLKRLGEEIEPIFLIPIESHSFWPIVREIRDRLTDSLPDAQAVGVYGSVARGATDRASDIDVLVLHNDRLVAQRKANELFKGFRYPTRIGERYTVNCNVMSEEEFGRLSSSSKPELREMINHLIWVYPPEGYKAGANADE